MSLEITKKAMLASLRIKLIGMSEVDRKATQNANRHFNTSFDAGRYQRCKIKEQDIKIVVNAAESARATHKRLTRPWSEKYRMLPAALALDYTKALNAAQRKFEDAVHKIEVKWLDIVKKQESRLKTLFNARDYPCIMVDGSGNYTAAPVVNLSQYFLFAHNLKPVPEKSHFVIELADEVMDEIKEKLETDNAQKMIESKNLLIKDLLDPIKNVADICSNDKKVFKTLIPSVEKMIDILPKLNIENDPVLTHLVHEARRSLTGYTTGQIRNDKDLKAALGRSATHLSEKIETLMEETPN